MKVPKDSGPYRLHSLGEGGPKLAKMLGLKSPEDAQFIVKKLLSVRFKWTGEYRAVQPGEWYLSGDPAEVYFMPDNLNLPTPYTGSPYFIVEPKWFARSITVESLKEINFETLRA